MTGKGKLQRINFNRKKLWSSGFFTLFFKNGSDFVEIIFAHHDYSIFLNIFIQVCFVDLIYFSWR